MPAGGNSRFRGYSARVSERQQLALIMQMTSQEMTSGSSNRSENQIPVSNVRSSPLQHQKSSKSRWSNKNSDLLDVNTSYSRQEDRLRLVNGCDSKDRGEFAGSNSPDEVRTASEAESPRAAGSPAECAATVTSTSTSSSVGARVDQQLTQEEQQQQEQHPESYEMRRTPPQNKVDRQASGQQQQQQQQQQAGGGGANAGNSSSGGGGGGNNSSGGGGGNSSRVTLRLNQVRATRDDKKGTSLSGTNVAGTATTAACAHQASSSNASSSRQAAAAASASAAGSTALNYNQTAMESSTGKSIGNSGNVTGSGVSGSGTSGNSGSVVSGSGSVGGSGHAPNSSSSSSSSADGGDVYEFKSSKEATPVRGSSSSPNPNPDKDGKDSNSSLASSTVNTQNQNVSSASSGTNVISQGSTVVGSSTCVSSSVSSTNSGSVIGSSSSLTGGAGSSVEAMSTSTDDQIMSTTSPQSSNISGACSTSLKRPFDSEGVPSDEQDEESRKRKKKENEMGKDGGTKGAAGRQATSRNNPNANDKNLKSGKQVGGVINTKGNQGNNSTSSDRKSPSMNANSPKPSNSSAVNANNPKGGGIPSATESDGEDDRSKNSDSAPKVPPLKIVIPQSTVSEQEQGIRNGKNNSNRGHQLPYVVASSNSNDSMDKDQGITAITSGTTSPIDSSGAASKTDEKKDLIGALDSSSNGPWHSHQRVLRSSHRSGNGGNGIGGNSGNIPGNGNYSNNSPLPTNTTDRSNNSSPQQRHQSPTPESSSASETGKTPSADSTVQSSPAPKSSNVTEKVEVKVEVKKETVDPLEVNIKKEPGSSESSNASSQQSVELHPRKRKMKPNKENQQSTASSSGANETTETPNTVPEIHPHDQPITNCYQLFLNIRKQIDKKRKGLFPVQPKPPQGFKDYLMNRCTYVLAGNANKEPTINFPINLPAQMKELYAQQEQVRHRLRMQHVVEKEKLVLSVEQEILRVHGRAARALANQSLPFSACTFLKDEEVYNVITPEQEEKDRNARSRYNGRLFLSWLQDVDDKWEKIKEGMLLRHHNEAESLHAVQRMDWEWKLKEVKLCEFKATPQIEDSHVPMVHVSDDFDLLPA